MKKIIQKVLLLFIIIISITTTKVDAQSLPAGSCGIVYTYDAAGNRTKVELILNNTQAQANIVSRDSATVAKQFNSQVIKVDAVYPNPTTGRIKVRVIKPLQNATVMIMDVAGHVLINEKANGSTLNYDLSRFAAGIYILHIEQGGRSATMKILKR